MAPNFEVNNFKLIGDDITTAFNDAEKKKKKERFDNCLPDAMWR